MLRRSDRKPKARTIENTITYAELGDSETDCGDDYKAPTKRRKTQKKRQAGAQKEHVTDKKPRGKRGSLKELVNMPLDILFEIFGSLNPVDILHLARTTKDLRAILMNRSSQWIWKRARANMKDFPDCPSDLTEPQYAHLAFDPLCHYCYETNTPTIVWTNRTRCCGKCLDTNFNGSMFMPRNEFRGIIPTVKLRTGSGRYRFRTKFCVRTWERYEVELKALKTAEWGEWIAEKRAHYQTIAAHAELCERWNADRILDRTAELRAIRLRRYNEIERRLTELGWGDDFKEGPPRDIINHPLVKQPRDLTDRIWEKIMPDLLVVMEDIKTQRLEAERMAAIHSRVRLLSSLRLEFVASQPLHSIIPEIGDLIMMEDFRTIIIDTPPDETVTTAHFSHAMKELSPLIEEWRRTKDNELLTILKRDHYIDNDATTSTLYLASTLFTCRTCFHIPISYPRVLVHSCFNDTYQGKQIPEFDQYPSWNTRYISFHPMTYLSTKSILESCGFDPNKATAQEILDANPLIECLECSHVDSGRLLMRYPNAVSHSIRLNHQKLSANISSDDSKRVIIKEKGFRRSLTTCHIACWNCVLCKGQLQWLRASHHLNSVHQIEDDDPIESGYIVPSLDAPLSVAGYEGIIKPGEPVVI
ncbi:hypothetical protein BDZ94DRAFT_1216309 [Collybia nuda]|uniref:F-box domain-containing protein n=1 Tax=Collybia nuda TaxID=64659 RepID=A0A9P6CLD1_9AGAR|nr:hypothetical protein BDZ94DRAFT_1216309 [Collybia nuda]